MQHFIPYSEYISLHPEFLYYDPKLPEDIKITTITTLFTFPLSFHTDYIADNIPLSENFIISIKHGNTTDTHRSIINLDKKTSNTVNSQYKSKSRKNFYFQTTLIIKQNDILINVKIFRNGTIQITGSKNISMVIWIVDIILKMFKDAKMSVYADPVDFCDLSKLIDFKIIMMNCVFTLNFYINRESTTKLLESDNKLTSVWFDPQRHSGINLKYIRNVKDNERLISLIIFEKGNIILSSAIDYEDIIETYKYVKTLLLSNYDNISKS